MRTSIPPLPNAFMACQLVTEMDLYFGYTDGLAFSSGRVLPFTQCNIRYHTSAYAVLHKQGTKRTVQHIQH
jgi:hypothetical protein